MESKPKEELIRVAWYEGMLSLDPTGKAKGRGVYLCKDPDRPQIEKVIEELKSSIRAEGDDHAE